MIKLQEAENQIIVDYEGAGSAMARNGGRDVKDASA
jgi:hypothetical protein